MNMDAKPTTYTLLLIEDSEADAELIRYILQSSTTPIQLEVASSSSYALDYLHQRRYCSQKTRPDLILLDLNIPGVNGVELLKEIKTHPDLMRIPVMVYSSSANSSDVLKSYQLHANGYLQKPLTLEALTRQFRLLEEFWFRTVTLPPKETSGL